jgi:anti-sigma B factor antagonist
MEITVRKSGHFHVVDIAGEMDFYSANQLRNVVQKMIEKSIPHFVIDLEDVACIDSSAVGTLVSVHSELEKKGRSLHITGVRGNVKRALELTRLFASLPIVSSLDEATQRLLSENGTP